MNQPICIYHGGCDDGFGAALAIHKAFPGVFEFHYGRFDEPPPYCHGRDVVLVDFSYKRPVMAELVEQAKSVLVLDHHQSAEEELAPWVDPEIGRRFNVNQWTWDRPLAIFDMKRSGAMMAWQFFHPGIEPPPLFAYIQDRDLWRKALTGTDEIITALRSYPQDFGTWAPFTESVDKLFNEGIAILRYYRAQLDKVKRNVRRGTIGGYRVPICNAPYFMASDLAGELAEGEPFAACYYEGAEHVTWSLRSRGDGVDVAKIAQSYGGGGHKHAAGFRTPLIDDALEFVLAREAAGVQ